MDQGRQRPPHGNLAAVMAAHGLLQVFREAPAPQQHAAEGGVVKAQHGPLGLAQKNAFVAGHGQHMSGMAGQIAVEHQPAHVVEQAGHEKPLHLHGPPCSVRCGLGQIGGDDAAADAVLPEIAHVDQPFGQVLEQADDRDAQGQGGELTAAHDGDGPGQGVDLYRKAVKGAVDKLQQLGRQAGVLADGFGRFLGRAVGII